MSKDAQLKALKSVTSPEKKVPLAPGYKQYAEFTEELQKDTHQFIDVTEIKEMVYKTLLPTLNQTKRLFEQVNANGKSIRDFSNQLVDVRQLVR
jgi:hypothetical protein